ncbi:hypothetical protein PF010_g2587 [Phytophthora fragariae]|uniref:Uncharacterized protein n=1 Tax=Phytophthora fragariae TaxID=53985 RepID=A0A6G0SD45_9STRA|nr:hypothetical protein PF010_g2587 [Phytophthora fragariae]KAE9186388.1 hypothetical protein PF004_g23103 [Phytophthora fragariae]KAE9355985.1 hypothetical protein PF008_g3826 [Phytophthora fragariae]
MLTLAGLQDLADGHGRHVAAQYAAVEAAFQSDMQWHGGLCTVDVSGFWASRQRSYGSFGESTTGGFTSSGSHMQK